ncbi:MAG: DNA topoisomerase IV subunit A [Victivallales bacterium]|nr:DNA topoisomerase IV subunit A [Victivallales bacterium]
MAEKKNKTEEKIIPAEATAGEQEFEDQELQEVEELEAAETLAEGETEAASGDPQGGNSFLRRMMEQNFIEYASYVIKERAIPDVDDGLKPVQRRILWSLFRMHDGKFHKVANVIGHTMQYHPHGDASIGGALVVLANKEYFFEKQGNFGNIYTGDVASAPRYIECRLSPLGLEVLFNNDITEFMDSYDGRNQEPLVLPVKIPSLLMLGTEEIAVGMSTRILPHNFCELLDAQIAVLEGRDFELYPDFFQGGSMDVSEYDNGNGKIKLRAKIDRDGRKLIIREIPAVTTTESLIASIERAVEKNKIKIASVNDYTAESVEIEIIPTRGQDPVKVLKALYAYTDCSVSVSCNMMVICDGFPVQMDVDSILRRNTDKLLYYLKRELEIELARLDDLFHAKTLAQIFIENRIYKRIEECESFENVMAAIYQGLEPFRDRLKRDVVDDDITKLLAIPIRRISLFDIRKNQQELEDILKAIAQVNKNLKHLKAYAIKYLQDMLNKYGGKFPRRTEIEHFKKIDRRAVALNNIKVGWDRKNGYIGTNVKSDDVVTCNEFDHLLCIERKGDYKVINIPEKIFVGRLYDFRKFEPEMEFGLIYSEKKSGKYYAKRTVIDKFIIDRIYRICPKNCRLELLTPRSDSVYAVSEQARRETVTTELNFKEYPLRTPKARGLLLSSRPVVKISHLRYLSDAELAEDGHYGNNEIVNPDNVAETAPADNISAEIPDEQETANGVSARETETAEEPESEARPVLKKAESETPEKKRTKPDVKAKKPGRPPGTRAKNTAEADEKASETAGKPEAEENPVPEKAESVSEAVSPKRSKTPVAAQDKTAEEPEAEKLELDDKVNTKSPKRPDAGVKKEKKSKPESVKADGTDPEKKSGADDDNEWGIVQPEFGF